MFGLCVISTVVPLFQENAQQKSEERVLNPPECWEMQFQKGGLQGLPASLSSIARISIVHGAVALTHSFVTETDAGSSLLQWGS